jgi:undecaprenyl-diphosphatase
MEARHMIMEWIEALTLGMVQGVTEFLPVSSDGHLLVTQQFFTWMNGAGRPGVENLFFDIMLHLGTTAAILYHYRDSIGLGIRGLMTDDPDVGPDFRRPMVAHVLVLAFIATLPLVPFALFLKKWVDGLFESQISAPLGFFASAAALALVSLKLRGPEGRARGPSQTTWIDALLIGLAQMLAPLPGVSRSGATIVAALLLGLSGTWAVRFSLMIAVPAVLGAVSHELAGAISDPARLGLTAQRVTQTIVATAVAGVVGYVAIVWLVRVVRSGKLWYFSVYLTSVATLVLALVWVKGGVSGGAGSPNALVRASGGGAPKAPAARPPLTSSGPLDRPDAPRL